MRTLELKVPPPAAALILGMAMWMAAHRSPSNLLAGPWRFLLTGGCVAFGVLIALLGFAELSKAHTTINPVNPERASSVVTGGIFGYTRNPMYVGLTALLAGWAFWLSDLRLLLGPMALALYLTRFQIVPEERVMASKFGRDYDTYRKRVRRWL